MEVNCTIDNDYVVDWTFSGEFTEEEAWDHVDSETQCMEEAGYTKTFEDFLETLQGGVHTLEISQIWSRELE